MALILAINPGNSHSPTLARLARELPGHELVGADSCAVAVVAIRSRVPDLVLLPDKSARGEAELLAQLRTIRGGVPTRKLPPVSSADPATLAKDIRAILTREPKPAPPPPVPAGPSPHVVAAAKAAISWIHARRAQWEREAASEGPGRETERLAAAVESRDRDEPRDTREPQDGDEFREADDVVEPPDTPVSWLPRAAVGAALLLAAAAGVWFWPQITGNATTEVAAVTPPAEHTPSASPGPALEAAASGVAPPDTGPTPVPGTPNPSAATKPAPADQVAGWIAVTAPFEVAVTRGNEAVTLDTLGRAVLDPGTLRLRFRNRELGYDETRTVEVTPAATTTIDLRPETTVGVTANEAAEVLIDGTRVGDTPFKGRMQPGRRTVTVRNASGERQFIIDATMKPVQLEVDFSRP